MCVLQSSTGEIIIIIVIYGHRWTSILFLHAPTDLSDTFIHIQPVHFAQNSLNVLNCRGFPLCAVGPHVYPWSCLLSYLVPHGPDTDYHRGCCIHGARGKWSEIYRTCPRIGGVTQRLSRDPGAHWLLFYPSHFLFMSKYPLANYEPGQTKLSMIIRYISFFVGINYSFYICF